MLTWLVIILVKHATLLGFTYIVNRLSITFLLCKPKSHQSITFLSHHYKLKWWLRNEPTLSLIIRSKKHIPQFGSIWEHIWNWWVSIVCFFMKVNIFTSKKEDLQSSTWLDLPEPLVHIHKETTSRFLREGHNTNTPQGNHKLKLKRVEQNNTLQRSHKSWT